VAASKPGVHRFRPRYRAIPWVVAAVGLAMLAFALLGQASGASRTFAIVAGAIGPIIALAYLRSGVWKIEVAVDDQGMTVRKGSQVRFQLPWSEVKEVVYSEHYPTLFIDGGTPERSLLVPGPGVPAQYRIERNEELCTFVRAHVPREKQRAVDAPPA
jgi:hypothetical protein